MSDTQPFAARRRVKRFFPVFAAAVLLSQGCATVPNESVELSYRIGQDLVELKQSYELLITEQFDGYRAKRLAYLDKEWTPAFIARWIENGSLLDTARGRVVFDEAEGKFVAPTPGRERQQLLSTINQWSQAAIDQIGKKRASLIDPLDAEEKRIRTEARQAFDRVIQANAVVTAHLASIRETKELQSRALEVMGLDDVVSKLNEELIEVSEMAGRGLEKIREGDELLDRAGEIRDRVRNND